MVAGELAAAGERSGVSPSEDGIVPLPNFGPDVEDVEVALWDLARFDAAVPAAPELLTDGERETYHRLTHPGRRREWLAARACLKSLLLRGGAVEDPRQCEVGKDPQGRPRLGFAPGFPRSPVADCSLSHKGRFACAAVCRRRGIRLGVDVEEISPRLEKLTEMFVNAGDATLDAGSPPLRLALLWSLKEACAKAVGVGMAIGLAGVRCEETFPGRHVLRTRQGHALPGWHTLHEGYVVSLCLWHTAGGAAGDVAGSSIRT